MSDIDVRDFLEAGDRVGSGRSAGREAANFDKTGFESAMEEVYGAIAQGTGRRGSAGRSNLATTGGDSAAKSFMGSDIYQSLKKDSAGFLKKNRNRKKLWSLFPDIEKFIDRSYEGGADRNKNMQKHNRLKGKLDMGAFSAYLESRADPYSALGDLAAPAAASTQAPAPTEQAPLPTPTDVNTAMADTEDPLPKPTDIAEDSATVDQSSYRRV